jgi:hypothetical protein
VTDRARAPSFIESGYIIGQIQEKIQDFFSRAPPGRRSPAFSGQIDGFGGFRIFRGPPHGRLSRGSRRLRSVLGRLIGGKATEPLFLLLFLAVELPVSLRAFVGSLGLWQGFSLSKRKDGHRGPSFRNLSNSGVRASGAPQESGLLRGTAIRTAGRRRRRQSRRDRRRIRRRRGGCPSGAWLH